MDKIIESVILEEINSRLSYDRCNEGDLDDICRLISTIHNDGIETVMGWLQETSVNYGASVKCLDEDGEMVGVLLFTDSTLDYEVPDLKEKNPKLYAYLDNMKYIEGFAFVIDPQYRGTGADRKMLGIALANIKDYDYVMVPVFHSLRTHNYWMRFGAINVFENEELKLYVIPLSEQLKKNLSKNLGI